jgi:hypothetical protein
MPSWHFPERRRGEKLRNSTVGAFFTNEAINHPGEALIREGIQNSLDAADDGPVEIRVYLSGDECAVDADTLQPYLKGAWEHYRAPGNGLSDVPSANDTCRFLVFEDFGTTGLQGDPGQDYQSTNKNPFYHFFRAEGTSDKSEQDRGRWGVGKDVFLQASQVKTLFGATVRSDDARRLLMGMAVLGSHEVGPKRYLPDGYYGKLQEDRLVMPVEDHALLDKFCRIFRVERARRPGLSVVVPWCKREITFEALVESVARNWFYPILNGGLTVAIETPDQKRRLDRGSIHKIVERLGLKEFLPVVQLAAWAHDEQPSDLLLCRMLARGAPKWNADLVPDDVCAILKQRLDSYNRVGIRVPVPVRKKDGTSKASHFDIFLTRSDGNETRYPTFVRKAITLPEVRPQRRRDVVSLVIIEDMGLTALLGDAENPSHTRWEETADLKRNYKAGKEYITFVRSSVNRILGFVNETQKEEDPSLLMDFFSLPPSPDEEPTTTVVQEPRAKPGTQSIMQPPPIPVPPPPRFRIQKVRGGFRVIRGEAAMPPPFIDIRVAYDVRNGNPLKKYHPADFELKKGHIRSEGVQIVRCEENNIGVRVLRPKFSIDVSGFDEQRDLYVRATTRERLDDH